VPQEMQGFGELPEMQAHHMDASTGEDEFQANQPAAQMSRQERRASGKQTNGANLPRKAAPAAAKGSRNAADPSDPASWGKVSRNALCPCGSGKKFKHCHGAIASAAAE
jgi:preprotein translocase subunit SecA